MRSSSLTPPAGISNYIKLDQPCPFMAIEKQPCQAEYHEPDCPCQRCRTRNCANCGHITLDHFTPKSIARKVLGWSKDQTDSNANTQWLSTPCHRAKDRYTGDIYNQALQQKRGGEVRFGDYPELKKRR